MVYAYTVPAAPRLPRPATVTVAGYLLYGATAALVVGAAAQFGLVDAVRRGYERDPAMSGTGDALAYLVPAVLAAGWLLPAAALVTLGILTGKGKQAARIVTWAVGGLVLCCCGIQTVNAAAAAVSGPSPARPTISTGTDTSAMAQSIAEAMPSWYQTTMVVTSLAVVATVFGALILLAVPASNDYFRKPVAHWVWEPVPMPPPTPLPPSDAQVGGAPDLPGPQASGPPDLADPPPPRPPG